MGEAAPRVCAKLLRNSCPTSVRSVLPMGKSISLFESGLAVKQDDAMVWNSAFPNTVGHC